MIILFMAEETTKQDEQEILRQDEKKEHKSDDYDEYEDWKRLEKWRPGRKNFP